MEKKKCDKVIQYIKKEFLEQIRSNGVWIAMILIFIASVMLLSEARGYPDENATAAFLLNSFDMFIYIIPLIGMFLAAFSVYSEKENKTFQMIITKRESFASFFFKKSISLQIVLLSLFTMLFVLLYGLASLTLTMEIDYFLLHLVTLLTLILIFNQFGILIGSLSSSKMQMIGLIIFVWFFMIFLVDVIFLYFIPMINYNNVHIFSYFFFMHPFHVARMFLEYGMDIFSTNNLSSLMNRLVILSPNAYMVINIIVWPILLLLLTMLFRNDGEIND